VASEESAVITDGRMIHDDAGWPGRFERHATFEAAPALTIYSPFRHFGIFRGEALAFSIAAVSRPAPATALPPRKKRERGVDSRGEKLVGVIRRTFLRELPISLAILFIAYPRGEIA